LPRRPHSPCLSPWVARDAGASLLPHYCAVSPPSAVPAVAALCLGVLTARDFRLGSPALMEHPCSRITALCRRRQLCLLWRLFASASSLSRLSPWFVRAVGASLLPHRCAVLPPSAAPAVAALEFRIQYQKLLEEEIGTIIETNSFSQNVKDLNKLDK
jgi:hypothetical protein